jgi:hypothetical protein
MKNGLDMRSLLVASIMAAMPMRVMAQTDTAMAADTQEAQVVEYPAVFFARFQPTTALDMMRQVPGFHLEDGVRGEVRGYAAAVGNILINNRRPSIKQDTPSAVLGRIPAGNVVRIDLIRGQMRGVDLQGQSIVANIILRDDAPASVRWEAFTHRNFDSHVLQPGGSISLSDRWSGIDYNAGVEGNWHVHSNIGSRDSYDADTVITEDRFDDSLAKHLTATGNLNASAWAGETLVQVNTEIGYDKTTELQESIRDSRPSGGLLRREIFDDERGGHQFELGANAERLLGEELIGRAVLLLIRLDNYETPTQEIINAAGARTLFRVADIDKITTEGIARAEFEWSGLPDHAVQFNVEGAFNALDSSQTQSVDTGAGPVAEVVPGANTRVEEVRGNFVLKDIWSLGLIELDYGLGAEVSELTQTGDAELQRSFFFIKPHMVLSYSPEQGRQTRLRIAREVSQLNFNDFVSAAVFQDDDLALGNPNLSPETTWISELVYEQRFGSSSVIRATAFHHWISDVEDLLPLTSMFEAPGNIGDGRRWGLKLESTVPLAWLGIDNARLNLKGRWQDSSVTDPVTGESRILSGETGITGNIPFRDEDVKYTAAVDYRQDFQAARVAWGWEVQSRGKRTRFKVNELDVYNEGVEVDAFIETTRWFGVKMRLNVADIMDTERTRDRTIFLGERGLSGVDRRELTDYSRGTQVTFTVNGNF